MRNGKNAVCEVGESKGAQDLCLRFSGGEGFLMNVDFWMFQ